VLKSRSYKIGEYVGKLDQDLVEGAALKVLQWAKEKRALADDVTTPPLRPLQNVNIISHGATQEAELARVKAEKALERLKIVHVAADLNRSRIVILTKNQVSHSTEALLPKAIDGVPVGYIGHASLETNPPHLPQSNVAGSPRYFEHNGLLACGSSVSAATTWGAGTLGALVMLADGTICGLTNNHVTGGCNHTQRGMHILSPAPFDADPVHPAPLAIGRHHSFVPLASGDPGQVLMQELDAAIFSIHELGRLTSMQGDGFYDTPINVTAPVGGMLVKKVGRTTGITHGEIIGYFPTALGIPYQSDKFQSMVYFQNAWAIQSSNGDPFSLGGDSGSLVVTEDGQSAVGLIFAGANNGSVSYMIPVQGALAAFGATLIQGHNV